jgi:hypothetical protein
MLFFCLIFSIFVRSALISVRLNLKGSNPKLLPASCDLNHVFEFEAA